MDSKYQYYLSVTESGKLRDRALEEHYADYKYCADIKSKIAIAVSEIECSFEAYYRLKNQAVPANTVTVLNTFGNLLVNMKKHDGFDENATVETEQMLQDTANLYQEYSSLIPSIRQLATDLS